MSDEALARSTDPDSSHAAAAVVDVQGLEMLVLQKIERSLISGLTASDIAMLCDHPRDSISPRMKRLEEKGMITRTDEKRVPTSAPLNRRSPKQIVWKITEKGLSILASKN